jgi:phytol kinase
MSNILPGLLATWAVFALLVAALVRCRRIHRGDPEIPRKGLHAGMGLASLALPCFFDTLWPVLGLALSFALALAARAWCPPVQRILRPILDDVGRPTVGELLFPIAVALSYAAAGGDRVVFAIPILILALADSAAALVGRRFGEIRYGGKSLEGSAAFCATAIGCTAIPLSLFSDLGVLSIALIALTVALLATLAEALSRHGLDNLAVPLTTLLLLRALPSLTILSLSLVLAGAGTLTIIAAWAVVRGADRRGRRRLIGREEPCRT